MISDYVGKAVYGGDPRAEAGSNQLHSYMAGNSEGDGARVGLAMSVVGAMIPLSITTLFPWVGPLTEWTGVVSTPLWVGAVFCCLAAAGFLFV
nr:hypothetical protein BaRGS_018735 [Batillaria attramentaria]